jgi:hypothetical protein
LRAGVEADDAFGFLIDGLNSGKYDFAGMLKGLQTHIKVAYFYRHKQSELVF